MPAFPERRKKLETAALFWTGRRSAFTFSLQKEDVPNHLVRAAPRSLSMSTKLWDLRVEGASAAAFGMPAGFVRLSERRLDLAASCLESFSDPPLRASLAAPMIIFLSAGEAAPDVRRSRSPES